MIPLEDLYFEWLVSCIEPDGATEGVAYVSGLLHGCAFQRNVGHDINRAVEGADLRKEFFTQFRAAPFDESEADELLMKECTWLEMLIALARHLDFTYDGGVNSRFYEMVTNMQLAPLAEFKPIRTRRAQELDRQLVNHVTSAINNNQFDPTGHGGIFPLNRVHSNATLDQRRVEIWDQCSAYFNERLEGVPWTSTM